MHNVLIIGQGSIGKRHAEVAKSSGCSVAVVTRQDSSAHIFYNNLALALKSFHPDLVIIANDTDKHFETLNNLHNYGYRNKVMVEKPLFINEQVPQDMKNDHVYVGYQLRFHPILQRLYKELKNKPVVTVNSYVGSYLPDWRPNTDYRTCYSAKQANGGGVLRDLSHEIDYLTWLFGAWKRVSAIGGKKSNLEIDSDDAQSILYETINGVTVSLQMNYLDRIVRREITVNTNDATYHADLKNNRLQINDEVIDVQSDRNDVFSAQLNALLNGKNTQDLCDFHQGLYTLSLIRNIEDASRLKKWIDIC